MTERAPLGKLVSFLVLLIGLHSCVLGVLMLSLPARMAGLLGFSSEMPAFFPSQSGIFLLILGSFYLAALKDSVFIWTIFCSKAAAVVFLLVHALFLGAPPLIWAAAAGDGGMLMALAAVWGWERRRGKSGPG